MNRIETFQQFLATQSIGIPIPLFLFNIAITALLAYILSLAYVRFGTSLSNRKIFARNFVLISMTTMFIITIVKTSLALSLGLVGALSIVRFRAAIKEPEELAYLLICIAIGLGMGADQRNITIAAFIALCIFIVVRDLLKKSKLKHPVYLTITSENPKKLKVDDIISTLSNHCKKVAMQRIDETNSVLEASFYLDKCGHKELNECRIELQKIDPDVHTTILDSDQL